MKRSKLAGLFVAMAASMALLPVIISTTSAVEVDIEGDSTMQNDPFTVFMTYGRSIFDDGEVQVGFMANDNLLGHSNIWYNLGLAKENPIKELDDAVTVFMTYDRPIFDDGAAQAGIIANGNLLDRSVQYNLGLAKENPVKELDDAVTVFMAYDSVNQGRKIMSAIDAQA